MKFSINRSVFIQNLTDVQRAISSRTTIPVLTGVKISVKEEGLYLTGSDATISIEAFIDAKDDDNKLKIEATGDIVLPSRFLGEIVKKLPSDMMNLEVVENFQTEITSDRASFTLNGINGSEYPRLPEIDAKQTYALPTDTFKQVVNQTIISVSNQEIRPIFTGIHFEIGNGELKAVATDSHRLSQRIMPLTMPEVAGDTVLDMNIPGRSLQELIRIVDSNEDIEMMVTDNQVLFKARNIYLYSRLLEGNYPNTDRLLPNDHSTIIEVAASELVNAVERALILSHEGKNNVVRLNISDQDIILSSQSAEVGNVEEEINVVKAEGEALEISFNPDYLREALKSFGQQNVQIGFQSSSHPFTLLPSDQTDNFNFVQLITPIRTPRG